MEADRQSHSGMRIIPFLVVIAVCLAAGLLLGSFTGGGLRLSGADKESSVDACLPRVRIHPNPRPRWSRCGYCRWTETEKRTSEGISPAVIITTAQGQPAVLRDFLADPLDAPSRLYQLSLIPQPSTSVAFDRQGFNTLVNRLGGRADRRKIFARPRFVELVCRKCGGSRLPRCGRNCG